MGYDPQANRRRPRPAADDPAPVDALLGEATATPAAVHVADDPPPTPAVTPAPADPPSDTVLINTGVVAVIGAALTLLGLRQLWKRRRRSRLVPVEE
jgi:hypothetical protein